jgi:hypothetical protein
MSAMFRQFHLRIISLPNLASRVEEILQHLTDSAARDVEMSRTLSEYLRVKTSVCRILPPVLKQWDNAIAHLTFVLVVSIDSNLAR